MIKTLKHKYEADLIIISDANSVYIEESLKNAGIYDEFTKIFTNPAEFTPEGRLTVTPFTNQTQSPNCAKNMCKGTVLQDYIKNSAQEYSFICYAGDGGNDFCPIQRLSENDLAFVRKGFALEAKIPKMKETKGLEVKSQVHLWEDSNDIMTVINSKLDSTD